MTLPTFRDKLTTTGPKKLLALDGGGIRGLISIQFLARIEAGLRKAYGRSDLVLADYFDYIGGTSTGAIIATLISLGMSVSEIHEFYVSRAKEMFYKSSLLKRFQATYVAARLQSMIRDVIGDIELGSDRLRTLLLLVMRNATTDSPWPVSNNPNAMFNDPALPECNLRLPLWQLVRASTAAPIFFPPEVITIGPETFIFVDGGVTTYNNPSFLLFLMATLESYKLHWPVGEENMLVISVGTGLSRQANAKLRTDQMNLLFNAQAVPSALIYSAQVEQDKLCRIFGKLRAGSALDMEIGDLMATKGLISPKLFSYMRYNVVLSQPELDGLGLSHILASDIEPMDRVDRIDAILELGSTAAGKLFDISHFDGFLT
jgi:patatin-like phospholipase/acyl hydrolase